MHRNSSRSLQPQLYSSTGSVDLGGSFPKMMRNDLPVAFPGISGVGGILRSSEPPSLPPVASRAASLLEEAVDLLVMNLDFAAAVDRCEKGCESLLEDPEMDDSDRYVLNFTWGVSGFLRTTLCFYMILAAKEQEQQ